MKNNSSRNNSKYYGNLPSNYLPSLGKQLLAEKFSSKDIVEDSFGNCSSKGNPIEANACSLIKDDYEIKP